MDLEVVILSEASQTQKEKYENANVRNLKKKKGTNEPIYKTEVELQVKKTNLLFPGGKEGRGSVGD